MLVQLGDRWDSSLWGLFSSKEKRLERVRMELHNQSAGRNWKNTLEMRLRSMTNILRVMYMVTVLRTQKLMKKLTEGWDITLRRVYGRTSNQ